MWFFQKGLNGQEEDSSGINAPELINTIHIAKETSRRIMI